MIFVWELACFRASDGRVNKDDICKCNGQLQPFGVAGSYQVAALCFCTAHVQRCSRMRSWRIDRDTVRNSDLIVISGYAKTFKYLHALMFKLRIRWFPNSTNQIAT